MSTVRRPPGNIHKIREFELEKITLSDEFDILQIVGEGWFGKILLVEHRATDTEMVLKALPKPYVSLRDFYREFHYGLHLGLHKNIVTTYDVAFETAGFYVFTQEYALLGDLTSNVSDSGIGELHSKKVAKQIASALDYMHSKDIVHRDVKLDNVLIYKSDFSRVKLCDFGESFKTGTIVERRNEWLPYSPPEVLQIKPEGTYPALPSHDVWQFAIVIFVCLTGCLPWQKAASDDPRYVRYLTWQGVNMMIPLRRTPKLFKLLSGKGSRMFRKFLEPRPERRPKNLSELSRFLDDRWLAKGAEKDMAEYEPDELCPSMYSFHSSPEEKNRVLWSLAEQGIETTVDRKAKKIRIKDWIESSVILEDDEEDDSGSASASPSSSVSREPMPGHISSVRAATNVNTNSIQKINTTIKDAANKHFDPRTGVIQQGPSEMGTIYRNQSLSNLSNTTIGPQSSIQNNSSLNSSLITLGSRNNFILSEGEGQPYNTDMMMMNLHQLDDDADNNTMDNNIIPMVNARLKNLPLFNTTSSNNSHNNHIYSNTQDADLIISKKNYKQSLSNTNLTQIDINTALSPAQHTLLQTTNTNNNQQQQLNVNNSTNVRKPMPIKRTKSDSITKVMLAGGNNNSLLLSNEKLNYYASTSSINLLNNTTTNRNGSSNNTSTATTATTNNNIRAKSIERPFFAKISIPEFNTNLNERKDDKQIITSRSATDIILKNNTGVTTDQLTSSNSKQNISSSGSSNFTNGGKQRRLGSPILNTKSTNLTIAAPPINNNLSHVDRFHEPEKVRKPTHIGDRTEDRLFGNRPVTTTTKKTNNNNNSPSNGFLSKMNGILSRSQTNLLSSSIQNGQIFSLPATALTTTTNKKYIDESVQTTTSLTMKDTPYDRVKKL